MHIQSSHDLHLLMRILKLYLAVRECRHSQMSKELYQSFFDIRNTIALKSRNSDVSGLLVLWKFVAYTLIWGLDSLVLLPVPSRGPNALPYLH